MRAAFFDIDGTIYRNSLLIEHFKKLIKYELLNIQMYEDRVKNSFKEWDERTGDYDKYLMGLADTYVECIKGISLKYNDFVSDQVMDLKGNRVYTYTRDMIKWHKDRGDKVIFISGSPDFLVSRMADKWKADDYCGTKYYAEDGKFSGEISPMWDSENKIKAIDYFREKYNLDMNECFAYGDTKGDLSMLKIVGNPRAVNPSKELFNEIRNDEKLKEKTEIIIERKDIVYRMSADVEVL